VWSIIRARQAEDKKQTIVSQPAVSHTKVSKKPSQTDAVVYHSLQSKQCHSTKGTQSV